MTSIGIKKLFIKNQRDTYDMSNKIEWILEMFY